MDIASISDYLTGEVVLVTGAGGSIGAELCRQIARVEPAKLVLLDNAEPALFEIERELVRDRGFLAAAAVGDVGTRSSSARCSTSTARASSSTPPRTSTSR